MLDVFKILKVCIRYNYCGFDSAYTILLQQSTVPILSKPHAEFYNEFIQFKYDVSRTLLSSLLKQ